MVRYLPAIVPPHRVACLAFDGMTPFEFGVVTEVFALPRPELGASWSYDFLICAERPGSIGLVGGTSLGVTHGLDALAAADTVVVPATQDVHSDPSEELLEALRAASARGARMVSICSGAFVLAATGLLDGRDVATHWRYADLLAARFPEVRVDADVLYTDGDDILTSAGTAAGIDLCLHLVRRDHGAAIANQVARRMVVAPHRDGNQAQFVEAPVAAATSDNPVAAAMTYALERLGQPLTLAELARHALVSERTLTRHFRAATGTSPGRWLLDQRIAAALPLLEAGELPVEHVGDAVGLPSPAAFRRHFRRAMGVPPSVWQRSFAGPISRSSTPVSSPETRHAA